MAVYGNFARPIDGESYESQWSITSTAKDEILVRGYNGKNADGTIRKVAVVHYLDADNAITLADFNGLPTGSVIHDFQAYKTHYKVGATTWKSSAAAT